MSQNWLKLITSVLKITLGLDREDFKSDYDTIMVHFTFLLIDLLTRKPAASFPKSTKIGQNRVSNPMKNLYTVKCATTDIFYVYLYFNYQH